jgi:hypothetical protein
VDSPGQGDGDADEVCDGGCDAGTHGVDGIGHGDDGGKDVNYLGCVFEWGARVRAVRGNPWRFPGMT